MRQIMIASFHVVLFFLKNENDIDFESYADS